MTEQLEIIKPDDWHVHFRDDEILKAVVPETTRHFGRSIVMPNLIPPILNGKDALQYKKRIERAMQLKERDKKKKKRDIFRKYDPTNDYQVLQAVNHIESFKFYAKFAK